MSKTINFTVRMSDDMMQAIEKIASVNGFSVAEQIRQWIQKGMDIDGYKRETEYIRKMIHEELASILDPAVTRIIKMQMKIGKAAGGLFFLNLRNLFGGKVNDADPKLFNDFVQRYMGKGVEYMSSVKDSDVNSFLTDNGAKRLKEAPNPKDFS